MRAILGLSRGSLLRFSIFAGVLARQIAQRRTPLWTRRSWRSTAPLLRIVSLSSTYNGPTLREAFWASRFRWEPVTVTISGRCPTVASLALERDWVVTGATDLV